MLHVVLIILVCPTVKNVGASLITADDKILNKCITKEQYFWKICSIYFEEAKSVALNILLARENYSKISKFTDELLVYLYLHVKLNKTITIRKSHVGKNRRQRRLAESQEISSIAHRIRKYSGEPEDAYIILVWDQFTLNLFLEKDSKLAFPNCRATYFLLFLETQSVKCNHPDPDIINFLPKLWTVYGVLNLVANAPCSCHPKDTFVYDPFYVDGDQWGRIRHFDIGEILEDPKKILFSLRNFKGYPIKVSMFQRIPTAVKNEGVLNHVREELNNSGNFGGMDGMVLSNMASYLNFSSKIYEDDYESSYGLKLENGTITGSLGDVLYKKADIAANSRFLIDYETDDIEFTSPVLNDLLCVIVPKSRRIPQWIMIFHCFALETWVFISLTFIVILVAWYLIRFSADIINADNVSRSPALEICSILFSVPIKLHRSFTQRIFLASCMALNVIIMGIFQGTLVTSFSIVSYYDDIDTLDEVADSPLRISTKLDLLNHDITSGLMLRLARKKLTSGDTPSLSRAAFNRDVAAIERKEDAKLLIKTNYTRSDGFPLLHIVSECPWSYFLSYIVPKGSAFLPRFNSILIRFSEAGLIDKWYQDTVDAFIISRRYNTNLTEHSQDNPFSLADVQTAFYILFIGIVTSTIIFICELFLHMYWIRYKFTP